MKPAELDADGKSYFEELLEEEANGRDEEVTRQKKLVEYLKRRKMLDERTEALEKEREAAAKQHVDALKRSHQSMQNATRTIEGAIQNITNLLTGQLLQAVHGFGRMFIDFTQKRVVNQIDEAATGKTKPGEKRPDTKGSGGADAANSSSQALAIAGPAGAVAAALLALAAAAKQTGDSILGIAKTASPAFSSAWSEALTYLMTSIGVHFLPGLMRLGGAITDLATEIANKPDEARSFGSAAILGLSGFSASGSIAAGFMSWLPNQRGYNNQQQQAAPGDDRERTQEEIATYQREKETARQNGSLVGSGGERNQQSGLQAFLNTMQQRMTSPGGFEDVTSAFKRVQTFDANQSDIQKLTLEVQQRSFDVSLQQLGELQGLNRRPSGAAP